MQKKTIAKKEGNKNIHQKIFTGGNKMKENFTELLLIIDESGSMQSLRKETLEELNNFIKEQQEQDGETRLTVIFFNTRINVVYKRVDINYVEPLDESFYRPNGMTALLDVIGTGIDALGDTLNKIPEPERPSKVLVAIMTDGMENESKLYSRAKIREMITHQTEKYSWEFNFLAANIDAKETAMSMGIDSERATQFDANVDGLHACFCAMRKMTATTRKPTKCI